jgi:hypothetical protein
MFHIIVIIGVLQTQNKYGIIYGCPQGQKSKQREYEGCEKTSGHEAADNDASFLHS